MWLYIFCIIVEDMNSWLSQEGGGWLTVEGKSSRCICFPVLLSRS